MSLLPTQESYKVEVHWALSKYTLRLRDIMHSKITKLVLDIMQYYTEMYEFSTIIKVEANMKYMIQ